MPTYDDLRNYFQESGDLQAIARSASTVPIVSGFALDVNPLWSLLYDIENNLIQPPPMYWPISQAEFFLSFVNTSSSLSLSIPDSVFPWMRTRYQGFRRRNLYASVKGWNEILTHLRSDKRFLPVMMTTVHRPLRPPEESPAETDDQRELSRLIASLRES